MSAPHVPPSPEERRTSSTVATAAAKADAGAATLPHTAGRIPDFFIVGHEKCGTTALYKMLRRHPQIFMPDHKEPRFFASDLRTAATNQKRGGTHPRTLEEYLALFAPAAKGEVVGEASPQYIRSPGAANRIAELQPDARIIAILREPASFLRSFHIQCVQSALETERDLRRAMSLEEQRRQHLPYNSWVMYSEHVRYVEQLRRFHAEFPAEQVLVLIYEDYRRENEETLRTVMRFLGVDGDGPIEPIVTKREELTAVRFMPLHRVSRKLRAARHRPARAGPVTRTVATLAPRPVQKIWRRTVYKVPPPADEAMMLELRRRFKPEVEALSDYLGRDLVRLWGYDAIG